jgi:hypothetical protein
MSGHDFDWNDNANVVLRAYGSIAVHENELGDVVVRQERDALEDEDRFVAIPVQDAEYVAHAIIRKANEIKAEWKDGKPEPEQEREPRLALPAPAHPTARPTIVKKRVA